MGNKLGRFLDWMVERAVPPFIEDRDQQRIAEEAAENGIRQTARVAALSGGILFALIAGILYMYLPSRQITPAPSEATRAAPQPGGEHDAKLRQSAEDLQEQLDEVTKERDTLQGKVTALEGQVAEVNKKLQAAKSLARPKNTPTPAKQATGPTRAPVLASRPSTYQCGDGRTVRNPAACRPANASAPGVVLGSPSAYRCGDGRSVRNPAECKPASRE